MNPIKTSKNDFLTPLTKKNLLNRKLLAEKLLLSQNNLSNINPNYSENYLFFNEKLSNINLKKDESENEDEDGYNSEVYNLSLSKDKNFLTEISSHEELKNNNTINNNNIKNIKLDLKIDNNDIDEKSEKENKNMLNKNIELFIKVNKKNEKKIDDKNKNNTLYKSYNSQYYNYLINNLDNSSPKLTHKKISRFSKKYRKSKTNFKLNVSSTIPVHLRVSSQPFQINGLNNPFSKYYSTDVNNKENTLNLKLNEDYSSNIFNSKISNYTKTNTKTKSTTLNEDFDLEENNALYQYSSPLKKSAVLEENYLFDSSRNQKFLYVKRLSDRYDELNSRLDEDIKDIVIKNVNINYAFDILKKKKNKKIKDSNNTTERIIFCSPQVSYNSNFSPSNKKRYSNKLYKKDKLNYNNNYKQNHPYNINRNYKNHFNLHSNINNNGINRIYIPLGKLNNIKVDYSKRNNFKFHEIKLSKEKSLNKTSSNKNSLYYSMLAKNRKIINSTSMDSIKQNMKNNNSDKFVRKNGIKEKKLK